jgi:hypothetical protein
MRVCVCVCVYVINFVVVKQWVMIPCTEMKRYLTPLLRALNFLFIQRTTKIQISPNLDACPRFK